MKYWLCLILLSTSSVTVSAQVPGREEKNTVEEGSPQALLLTRINEEADDAKRIALCLEYEKKFVKSDTIVWVYDQLRSTYLKLNRKAEALDVSRRVLAADPENLGALNSRLEDAAERKDAAAVQEWAIKVNEAAKLVIATTGPGPDEEPKEWKQRVDFAREINAQAEYELYSVASRLVAKEQTAAMQVLSQRYPDSKYLRQGSGGGRVMLNGEAGLAAIDKSITEGKADDEQVLMAATYYLSRSPEKAMRYCHKLLEIGSGPRPATVPESEWPHRKTRALGHGNWMLGMIYSSTENYVAADRSLRVALGYLKGDEQKTAMALFHLGYANFRLADSTTDKTRVQDAIRFTEQCIKLNTNIKAAAMKNLSQIKTQYNMQ